MKAFLLIGLACGLMLTHSTLAQLPPAIKPGAERLTAYLPLLKGKTVAVFANQTSMVGNTHLVDTLLARGVAIKKIFAPEHGFRGDADAGEHVANGTDAKTGLPIVSLYGTHRKPAPAEVADVDIIVFDVQDVGLRYYTYISSLEELMEVALENNKPLLILDRPNPNGFYVDGPVLEDGFKSFVGMQKVPVVYGMTIGEYAMMLQGERWLNKAANTKVSYNIKQKPTADTPFHVLVIKCENYTNKSRYLLPQKPSPNLPNMQSIWLYSSTCYFEGTEISLGRGTDKPFQLYGHPAFADTLYQFTPVSTPGAKNPPLKNKPCYGYDLSKLPIDVTKPAWQKINLSFLLNAYQLFPNKDSFFLRPAKTNPKSSDYFFNKLAGNDKLMWQIMNGYTETEIRKSWEPGLAAFRKIRAKYLLYAD
ncbi:MAG: DUF1343 domain-containing protein [Bacteroidetes bacterium]|nr:MAG: DUF1343 domain-containing protein [Bacteroidota bacterium]